MGTIAELLLDPDMGSIAYAVLSFEERGRSDHTIFFALPWNVVRVNPVQHTLVARVDKKMLAESRKVSRDRLGSNSSAEILDRREVQTQRH